MMGLPKTGWHAPGDWSTGCAHGPPRSNTNDAVLAARPAWSGDRPSSQSGINCTVPEAHVSLNSQLPRRSTELPYLLLRLSVSLFCLVLCSIQVLSAPKHFFLFYQPLLCLITKIQLTGCTSVHTMSSQPIAQKRPRPRAINGKKQAKEGANVVPQPPSTRSTRSSSHTHPENSLAASQAQGLIPLYV